MSGAETPPIQAEVDHLFISSLFSDLAVNYVYLASMTILAYDYILMFRHELRFIWQSNWRLGKVLYLATRYVGLFNNTLALIGNFHHGLNTEACSVIEVTADWALLAEIGIAQIVLYIRTYVIWGQSRRVKYLLIALYLVVVIAGCVGYKFTALRYFPMTLKMVPACGGTGRSIGIAISYGLVCFSELAIVLLTIWRCVKYELRDMSSLLFVLYRDGILFFLCLFAISSFNVAAALLWRDLSMLQCVMHSVLTSRVILHLHIASAGDGNDTDGSVSFPIFAESSRRHSELTDIFTNSLRSTPR